MQKKPVSLLQLCQPALSAIFSWDSLKKMTIESGNERRLLKIGVIYAFTGDKNIEDEITLVWDHKDPEFVIVEPGTMKIRMPIGNPEDEKKLNDFIVEFLD